jgi:hypothetical protein
LARSAVFLLVIVTACTSTGVATTTSPPGATATTSAGPPPATAIPEDLDPPELPDPFDLADEALADLDIPGFEFTNVDGGFLESVRLRIGLFTSVYSATIWDELVSADDDQVVVFSLYPTGAARGDPSLAMELAEAIGAAGGYFAEPEGRSLGGHTAYELVEEAVTWLLWANNTHLFIVVGDDDAPTAVMEGIMVETASTEYQWEAGDCLHFDDGEPYAPFGQGNVVPCDGPHQWEVTRSAPLPDPADAAFPDRELSARVDGDCEEAFFEFTGILPVDSALNQLSYLPDEAEWAEGDRYFACIVGRSDRQGGNALIVGSLEGEATAAARQRGDCYRRFIDIGKVSCGDPHVFEYIGTAEYPGDVADVYPGAEELEEAFGQACQRLLDDYSSEATVEGASATGFPLRIASFAWDMGRRHVPCFGYARGDGMPLDVVGSFSEGWGPLGDADGSIQV